MDALNNTVMRNLFDTVSNSVVPICVAASEPLVFSGIVLVRRQNFIYIATLFQITEHIGNSTIRVKISDNNFITLGRNNFDLPLEDSGIVGIRVEGYGFQDLAEINFNEDGIQDQQTVYTYHIDKNNTDTRMLTPGSIILIDGEKGSFDHNSAIYTCTHCGAPVLNENGLLVGICYHYSGGAAAGYLSAYDAVSIADDIRGIHRRPFEGIAVALQYLRDMV